MADTRLAGKRTIFSAPREVEIEEYEVDLDGLGDYELVVAAKRSVISPGTELAHFRGDSGSGVLSHASGPSYPFYPGYAMVGEVLAAGIHAGFGVGDHVLSHTRHQSVVRFDRRSLVCMHLPDGLDLNVAPFARLAQVSGVSLIVSSVRPGDVVAVLGLGPVGNLAAQLARTASCKVVGIDPSTERRKLAEKCGVEYLSSIEDAEQVVGSLGGAQLVLECSGRAAAVVLATGICARHGEVMTVGAPWVPEAEVAANSVLARVFERYLSLRSGWEWQVPLYDAGSGPSVARCTAWVLDLLAEGSIDTAPLRSDTITPDEIGVAYERLDTSPEQFTTFVVNWEC